MSEELCGCGAVVKNDICSDLMRHSHYLVSKIEAKYEETEILRTTLTNLEDEAFRVVDSEPDKYPHLKRAVEKAQKVLEERK